MSTASQNIVNKAWNFTPVLWDDGLSYMAYTEQITFLLFLKMADERPDDFMLRSGRRPGGAASPRADHHQIKFNFYPDPRNHHVVSLRLFGSRHVKNKVFSRILTPQGFAR